MQHTITRLAGAALLAALTLSPLSLKAQHIATVGVDTLMTTNHTGLPQWKNITLPYATDALQPVISKRTVELHHGKHLAGYVAKLNKLIVEYNVNVQSLPKLVLSSDGTLFDNAGQYMNHRMYFMQFKPYKSGPAPEPKGELRERLLQIYGSIDAFRASFEKAGADIFGSGWLWLACDRQGKLYIDKEPNAGSPVTRGLIPLIAIDVWEHAYYLDYENRRADHLKQIWNILDWDVIEKRFEKRAEGVVL